MLGTLWSVLYFKEALCHTADMWDLIILQHKRSFELESHNLRHCTSDQSLNSQSMQDSYFFRIQKFFFSGTGSSFVVGGKESVMLSGIIDYRLNVKTDKGTQEALTMH